MKTQDIDQPHADKLVLYVEDEPVNALLMRLLFEHRPQLRLEVATSGRQALALAKQERPALLLLDLRLPDCFGTELLTLLRREPGWQDLPAVAVTTEPGFEAAGSDFLEVWPKPMNLQRALTRLDALLDPRSHGAVTCPCQPRRCHATALVAGDSTCRIRLDEFRDPG